MTKDANNRPSYPTKWPRARLKNGSTQTIEVTVAPSYIRISTYPHGATIHIPRDVWWRILKWVIAPSRRMTHSFDVEGASSAYIAQENEFTDELRRQKRERRGPRRKRRPLPHGRPRT